jgi:hypothetical protein
MPAQPRVAKWRSFGFAESRCRPCPCAAAPRVSRLRNRGRGLGFCRYSLQRHRLLPPCQAHAILPCDLN